MERKSASLLKLFFAYLDPKAWILALIGLYQKTVSRLKQPCCRFVPSCSEYAVQAIERYGLIQGLWKSVQRILRCHPFHPGGYDPP